MRTGLELSRRWSHLIQPTSQLVSHPYVCTFVHVYTRMTHYFVVDAGAISS